MTLELNYLVASVALAVILAIVAATATMLQVGLLAMVGNREGMAEPTGFAGRANRAHANMLENLVLFAVLVLTAKLTNVSTAATVLGAQLFFFARIAHAIFYLIGIPWLRTFAYLVSLAGLAMIFSQLGVQVR